MRQSSNSPIRRRAWRLVAIALVIGTGLSLVACKSKNQAITENASAPVSTGTVQATLPVDPTMIAVPELPPTTSTVVPTATPTNPGANSDSFAAATAPDPAKPGTFWPKRVGDFASAFKGSAWYPKYLPKGYKFNSLDIVEFDPGSGLVCDIIFTKGEKVLQFTQGSPKNRDYEVVSSGRVPWGTGIAWIVHQDPADTSTPVILVYNDGANFAELSGDISNSDLKAIAASMVAVK